MSIATLPARVDAVTTQQNRLTAVTTPDSTLAYDRRLFSNRKSVVLLFGGPNGALVVKQVREPERIREEHAAIELLRVHPDVDGFVPTAPLMTQAGRCFSAGGSGFFVMPHVGCDMVVYRERHAREACPGAWARLCVDVVAAAAGAMLSLWVEAGATYYDIKARNILWVGGPPPRVLLCDTGSINSRAATHHVPSELTRAAPHGSVERYRLYVAWGLACTLLELLDGPEVPRELRRARKEPAAGTRRTMLAAYERVCADLRDYPDAQDGVLDAATLLIGALARGGPDVATILSLVAGM